MTTKKVFISYSWTSTAHEDWVMDLAQRLVSDGIQVVLDKWDLQPGQDKYAFMESMVHADDIDKVLIILDKAYVKKANDRSGGVGTETLIISPKVYESTIQVKFIPIVAELGDDGNAPLPTYLTGKIYIDLSQLERFEESYEKLLRDIYQRPSTARPKLGNPPRYLFEDTPMNYKTSTLLRGFDTQVDKHPTRINPLINDFFDAFLDNLKDFKFDQTASTYYALGEKIVNTLNQYIPLRNDYVAFVDKVFKLGNSFDETLFVSFFEKLGGMTIANGESERNQDFDTFKFFRYELFLYTIAVGLKREHYKMLEELLHARYFFTEHSRGSNKPKSFDSFYFHCEAIDQFYKKYHNKQFFSCEGDLLITRLSDLFDRDSFVEADLLCYYLSCLQNGRWYPVTYAYRNEYNEFFHLFSKLISARHFEKVKGVFGVDSVEELKTLFEKLNLNDERGFSGSFHRLEKVSDWVDTAAIATTR